VYWFVTLATALLTAHTVVNARLLRADWPLLRISLDPKVRRSCERRLRLRA